MKKSADANPNSMRLLIPIIISTASLIISFVTLWYTKLSPSKLIVSDAGRIELTSNPIRANKQLGLALQAIFYNEGAQQGFIQDMAMVLQRSDSSSGPILLRGALELADDSLNLGKELPAPKMSAFTAIPVKGGETVVKRLIFLPDDPNSEIRYAVGKYTLTPYTIEAGPGEDWKSWTPVAFEVDAGDLDQLSNTTTTPSGDGRNSVYWITQSKVTSGQENQIRRLRSKIGVK